MRRSRRRGSAEAGKGFAVVASEVKLLATQTARSTSEISRHINEERSATSASVDAVAHIEQTIGEIRTIATAIAAAVEQQQNTATAEIARVVTLTAAAAQQMSGRNDEVSVEADTARRAIEVLHTSSALGQAMDALRHSVVRVVDRDHRC